MSLATVQIKFNSASYMPVTLSCDHRVVETVISLSIVIMKLLKLDKIQNLLLSAGAIAAEWLKTFKRYIENPESMLL